MAVQDNILSLLLKENTRPISGQKLADRLQVSRNAVWKAVNQLKEEGYEIDSVSRKGYQLKKLTKSLDQKLIKEKLADQHKHIKIITKDSVTSTNDLVKQHLIDYPKEDVLVASNIQTQGRGRRGKSFYSNLKEGLYFSIGIQPNTEDMSNLPLYTVLTASALVKTLEKHLEDRPKIKWVNDIFYKGRKVSGILSEVTSDLESGSVDGIIIGVGLNLAGMFNKAEQNVQEVAGSIFGDSTPDNFNQNTFLAEFLSFFSEYEAELSLKTFLPIYKEHLLGLNQEIKYMYRGEEFRGIIRDIDKDAHLIVEDSTGSLKTLVGQEISFTSRQFIERSEG